MHHHIHRLPSSSFPSQRIFAILFPQNLFARKKRKKRKKERKERKKEKKERKKDFCSVPPV